MPRWAPVLLLVALLSAAAALGLDRAVAGRGEASLADAYGIAVGADLLRDRATLEAARDSVREQIRAADAVLNWLGERETIGTPRMMRLLRSLLAPAPAPLVDDAYRDLVATGRARLLPPPLREALARYYAAGPTVAAAGTGAAEDFADWIDAHADHGAWIHLNAVDMDPAGAPLEFGPTIAALEEAGLEAPVRGVRRGLQERRDRIDEALERNRDLLVRIDELRDS